MTDEEFAEMTARYNWKTGMPIPRGMLLEVMLPGLNALFGLEYEKPKKAEEPK